MVWWADQNGHTCAHRHKLQRHIPRGHEDHTTSYPHTWGNKGIHYKHRKHPQSHWLRWRICVFIVQANTHTVLAVCSHSFTHTRMLNYSFARMHTETYAALHAECSPNKRAEQPWSHWRDGLTQISQVSNYSLFYLELTSLLARVLLPWGEQWQIKDI